MNGGGWGWMERDWDGWGWMKMVGMSEDGNDKWGW